MDIKGIINEEIGIIVENNIDDIFENIVESKDRIIGNIFNDFLFNNNVDFTKRTPWSIVPFTVLKKIWDDFIKYGHVRHPKYLDKIEGIVTRNILKVEIFTVLSGHTSENPDYIYDEYLGDYLDKYIDCFVEENIEDPDQLEFDFDDSGIGYKRKEPKFLPSDCKHYENTFLDEIIDENREKEGFLKNLKDSLQYELTDRFIEYYIVDKEGQAIISDFGLKPLLELLIELKKEKTPEKRLVTIDKILNVVHQRSDIAAWFIQGGSESLSNLSGYHGDGNH